MIGYLSEDRPFEWEIDKALIDFGFHYPAKERHRLFFYYDNYQRVAPGYTIDDVDAYYEDMYTMTLLKWKAEAQAKVGSLPQVDAFEFIKKHGTFPMMARGDTAQTTKDTDGND